MQAKPPVLSAPTLPPVLPIAQPDDPSKAANKASRKASKKASSRSTEPRPAKTSSRQQQPDDSEDDDLIEATYVAKQAAQRILASAGQHHHLNHALPVPTASTNSARSIVKTRKEGSRAVLSESEASSDEEEDEEESSSSEEEEEEEQPIVHESLQPSTTEPLTKKRELEADDSMTADDDASRRTLFLGNVPIATATTKPLKKSLLTYLQRTITTILPSHPPYTHLSIESIRFRSLPLTQPVLSETDKKVLATAAAAAKTELSELCHQIGIPSPCIVDSLSTVVVLISPRSQPVPASLGAM